MHSPSHILKLVIGKFNAQEKIETQNRLPRKTQKSSKTKKKGSMPPNISDGNTPVIVGHHKVPPVAPPRLRITHLADPFIPSPHTYDPEDDLEEEIEVRKVSGMDSMTQDQVVEMLKMHERLLYTILATIGIPLVIVLIFYIEVSRHCFCFYLDIFTCTCGILFTLFEFCIWIMYIR